ncbi:MAG: hypothetical protein KIT18_08605, partial [Burkholderiales bacterium]|nr:hypothetical protein [Burkholderiales bacterium]
MAIEIMFLGGAGAAIGSKYPPRAAPMCLLADCGLFRQPKMLRPRNCVLPPMTLTLSRLGIDTYT